MMLKYVAMVGNMSEGFTAFGPFDTFDEADLRTTGAGPAWIMELHPAPPPSPEEVL
jgi:hypothetical protein